MLQHQINTIQDIVYFIEQIAQEIEDFHPMTDFKDYVYPDSYFRRYTDEEAEIRNKLLDRCFDVSAMQGVEDFFTLLLDLFEQARDSMLVEQG